MSKSEGCIIPVSRGRDGVIHLGEKMLAVVHWEPLDDTPTLPQWRCRVPYGPADDLVIACAGRTKSEARADAKRRLRLSRLPVGTFLYRVA